MQAEILLRLRACRYRGSISAILRILDVLANCLAQ